MQPADVLLKCYFPGDRHRQKERIEPRVVESFTNVASCCQNQSRCASRDRIHRFINCFPLFLPHAAFQDKKVLSGSSQQVCQMQQMIGTTSK